MSYYGSSGRRSPGRESSRHGSNRRTHSPRRSRYERSESPGPSRNRGRSPSDENALPSAFGRGPEDRKDDDLTVLQRMKTAFVNSPLGSLRKGINSGKKIKVWTRNHKEVRGISTAYLVAFDKHWNLIVKDVDEVYIKARKNKTPFLRDIDPDEDIPEMEPKVPKKPGQAKPEIVTPKPEPEPENQSVDKPQSEKKKRRKRKKPGPTSEKRHVDNISFIRGDNIVMVALVDVEEEEEEED